MQMEQTDSFPKDPMRSPMPEEPPLSNPIGSKIAWAEACYRELGSSLLKDSGIAALLSRLEEAISASRKEMAATGIVEICRECEEIEGGSCCGAGLENRYNARLLLINLLLGVRLPAEGRNTESCFFLGESGCLLQARHVICVNYVCRRITDRIDPAEMAPLRRKEGDELEVLFLLHERIGKVLSR